MRDSEKFCFNCAKYKLVWGNYFGKLSRFCYITLLAIKMVQEIQVACYLTLQILKISLEP